MAFNRSKPLILAFFLALAISGFAPSANAQVVEREQLLNGLRVVLLPKPGSPDVLIKLRIHSGAAFDLVGKSGQMALLGDILFPDKATIEYFTDEMGGRLDVAINYDSLTITMEGKASELERILDVLKNALVSTQLTPDVVTRIRDARVKIIRDTAISPALVADRAVAARLFGDFPYGRPVNGTAEDVARVERADLMLSRDRFLNSNNATLTLVGGVTKPRALRALRQLLGPWRKSEQVVPSTFRQPTPPDPKTLVISGTGDAAELRLAVRGIARSDPDYYAASVLAKLVQHRWETLMPDLAKRPTFARSESHFLPGMFLMGTSVPPQAVPDAITSAKKVMEGLATGAVTPGEMDRARSEVLTELNSLLSKPDALSDGWLDQETYRLSEAQPSPISIVNSLTPADLQRLAARLLNGASATVVLGDPQLLKTALTARVAFEVLGEVAPPKLPATTPKASPSPSPE
ncbi:MAG TPA: pitrilysin family protein [Pyrinomonadaceae bacterium]|nr:pitrilysin family protein [Pyrinomonadaceae bacterium]